MNRFLLVFAFQLALMSAVSAQVIFYDTFQASSYPDGDGTANFDVNDNKTARQMDGSVSSVGLVAPSSTTDTTHYAALDTTADDSSLLLHQSGPASDFTAYYDQDFGPSLGAARWTWTFDASMANAGASDFWTNLTISQTPGMTFTDTNALLSVFWRKDNGGPDGLRQEIQFYSAGVLLGTADAAAVGSLPFDHWQFDFDETAATSTVSVSFNGVSIFSSDLTTSAPARYLGFFTHNGSDTTDAAITADVRIDNLALTVVPEPMPSFLLGFTAVIFVGTIFFRRSRFSRHF